MNCIGLKAKLFGIVIAACTLLTCPAAHTQQQQSSPAPHANLDTALNVSDLAISMAESSFKINPSLRAITELSSALEAYLTKNCFGSVLQTLRYDGPPTEPACIARMERLLGLYPSNPVAICLRDGMAAQTCSDAYHNQSLRAYSGDSSSDSPPDLSLKAGLSAADLTKVKALEDTLRNVNNDYQKAAKPEDKEKLMDDAAHLYDQLLSIACKIVVLKLEDPSANNEKKEVEDPLIRDAREKLLKVPPALRPDYQKKMLLEAETELARLSKDPVAQKKVIKRIEVINNPEQATTISTEGKLRVRLVLPTCESYIKQASSILPNFPSPACHRDGWYSPQCIAAIKRWQNYKHQLQEAAAKRSGKPVPPTPNQVISSF